MAKDDSKYILNEQFLNELFSMAMKKKDIIEVCVVHLKFHYIQSEPYKEIWSTMKSHYLSSGTIPSYGVLYQTIQSSMGKKAKVTLDILSDIRTTEMVDTDILLEKLDQFIKDSMSVEFFNEFGEKYKSGDRDGARGLLFKTAEQINNFSVIGGTRLVDKVFGDFEERNADRVYESENYGELHDKIPFGIDELDQMSGGGMDNGDMFCAIMRSGAGKTKLLRHVGVSTARRGFRVLHIQAEGTKKKCMEGYDQTWTAMLMTDVKKGSIPADKYEELRRVVTGIGAKGGEIYVHAIEKFGGASMNDVRAIAMEILKKIPSIDMILADYLELFDPSDGIRYSPSDERHRRLAIANKMKNLAVELDTRLGTCTQANDIPVKLLDDPDFVITRSNVSECKGLVNPFSFYFSGNQTRDEYHQGVMRLYIDKMRDYHAAKTITIYQNYDRNRFYDRRKTLAALSAE